MLFPARSTTRTQPSRSPLPSRFLRFKTRPGSICENHWDKASTFLTPELGADLVSAAGSFCSAEARASVESFFTAHKVPAADTYLKHAIERIDGCIELRRLQDPNLKTWLEQNQN